MIGTLEEAQEIFEAVGDRIRGGCPPPGWREVGAGGTRHCYLSPSGTVYKICYEYEGDEPSYNDREHLNLEKIRKSGRLPQGWRVPKSYLHAWERKMTRFNTDFEEEDVFPRVSVIAMEYIPGKVLGSFARGVTGDEWWDMEEAFKAVGLFDTGGANAIKAQDGTRYIIDAAEDGLLIGV